MRFDRLFLLTVALLATAVTYLNHYTTQQSVAYFHDASQYEISRLAQIQATTTAQIIGYEALQLATLEGDRSAKFEADYNQMHEAALKFRAIAQQYFEIAACQAAYIQEIEAFVKENGLELPVPDDSGDDSTPEGVTPAGGPGPDELPDRVTHR